MRIIEAMEDTEQLLAERTSTPSTSVLFSYFSTSDVKKATKNFDASMIIGEGGYGFVYKGLLGHTEVAIKVLHAESKQGPLEFQREMDSLTNLRHPNLVTLVGACLESRALIYEYLHGGSLEDRLNCKDNSPPLPWQTRIRIATELCTIVDFLHSNEPNSIIHGDLKPGNILLDKNLVCKLSDFGVCHLISRAGKNLTNRDTSFITAPRGTFLYMDPEFITTGAFSKKSDVYSFGVILLRLLTGKPAVGIAVEVKNALDIGILNSILDPSAGDWPLLLAEELAHFGLSCCEKKRTKRPGVLEVWRFLKLIRASCIAMHQNKKHLDERLCDLTLERDKALEEAKRLRKQLAERTSTPIPKLFSLFSPSDLKNATNNFDASTKIGQGCSGLVYKGLLGHTEVAIKVLHPDNIQGPLKFQREMDALSNLRHPNVVTLVGACLESRALIYEFLHGGSLEDRLNCKDNSPPLPWQTRIRIATELCSIVVFLHSNEPNSIIHGDLKPGNILLDENLVCKLSDFGICHLISRTGENSNQDTSFFTSPRGTFYYMDPEFLTTGVLSRKSDVYSFGVILLRLLTGKTALSIADVVTDALGSGDLKSILDPIAGEWPFAHAEDLARLGLSCCEMKKRNRPDLVDVWRVLKVTRASFTDLSMHQRVSDEDAPAYFDTPIFEEYSAERLSDLELERDKALEEAEQLRKQLAEKLPTPSTPKLFSHFSISDVKNATNNFDASIIIGQGGYGFIYKGLLGDIEVAIKVLHPDSNQGPLEFQREMDALSNLQHPNLVTLVGACLESRSLIYGYLHGGSLEDRLNCKDNSPPLPWQTRIRIAIELCSVVVFLHSNAHNSIIHGDLKPVNILLDENMVCKLSDFGICHLISRTEDNLTNQDTSFFTSPRGTFYYMDPEFLTTGVLSKKSDVYSVGVILLRLLTGKPATGIANIVMKALASDNNVNSILDPLAGEWPSLHAIELARMALSCCEMQKRKRPDLIGVLRFLKLIKASCIGLSTHERVGDDEPPTYFLCPIFQEIMEDPHFAADGFTYERKAIEGWLELGSVSSPMTNMTLQDTNIVPNHALHSAIKEWLKQNQTP